MAKEVVVERVVACTASAAAPLAAGHGHGAPQSRHRARASDPFAERRRKRSSRHLVTTVSGGFPLEYEERPYEWVEPTRFSVRRDVRRGLVTRIVNSFESRPVRQRRRVTVRVSALPKFGVIAPVLRLQVSRFVGRIAAYIEQVDALLGTSRRARGRLVRARRRSTL